MYLHALINAFTSISVTGDPVLAYWAGTQGQHSVLPGSSKASSLHHPCHFPPPMALCKFFCSYYSSSSHLRVLSYHRFSRLYSDNFNQIYWCLLICPVAYCEKDDPTAIRFRPVKAAYGTGQSKKDKAALPKLPLWLMHVTAMEYLHIGCAHRNSDSPLLMQVLLLCRQPTADMPLRFIHIQDCPGLAGKGRVNLHQTFCYVLVYRAFANSKFFCRLADSCIFLNYIISNIDCPFFYVTFQRTSPYTVFNNVCRVLFSYSRELLHLKRMIMVFLLLSRYFARVIVFILSIDMPDMKWNPGSHVLCRLIKPFLFD